MRKFPGLSLLLFAFAAFAADLTPRQVLKRGDVEVPPGMHLVTTNTGNRWLLPDGMDEPPERDITPKYFKPRDARPPREIGKIQGQTVLDRAIAAEDTVVSRSAEDANSLYKKFSKEFANVMDWEKGRNEHALKSPDLQSLGVFGPAQYTTFKVPYIPIPADKLEYAHLSDFADPETKKLLYFKKDGKEYVRYFVHPNHVDAYEDLIRKYGIVYHYEAMSTSSPRSLIVIDPENPRKLNWVKVSIHRKIDGSVRINTPQKARRSVLISGAMHNVPEKDLDKYGVEFMYEPASFQAPGKDSAVIIREVNPSLARPPRDHFWLPAIFLKDLNDDAIGAGPNIRSLIRQSGKTPREFMTEDIIRPLLKAYLSLGLKEGLPGELHVQNFYYEFERDSRGRVKPTGKLLFKDNDGFRYDTELALRNGRELGFFNKFEAPQFYWGKFSNALGTGAEGIPFLGSWYYKLIRNVSGFETLSSYSLAVLQKTDPRGEWDKDKIQKLFDKTAVEEAEKITGIHIGPEDYGFGADKGLNKILNEYRAKLSREDPTIVPLPKEMQPELKRQFERLDREKHAHVRRTLSEKTEYVLHRQPDGAMVIEARVPNPRDAYKNPTVGLALLEPQSDPKGLAARQRLKAHADRSCGQLFVRVPGR